MHVADQGGSRLAGCSSSGPLMLHPSFRLLPDPCSRLVPRALQARGRQTTAPWLNPAPCPAFVCTGNLARRQPGAPTCLVSTVAGASAGDTKPRQFSIWPRRECPDPCTSSLSSWPVPPALQGQPPSSPEAPHGGGGRILAGPSREPPLGKTCSESSRCLILSAQTPAVPTTHFATLGNVSASPSFCCGRLR